MYGASARGNDRRSFSRGVNNRAMAANASTISGAEIDGLIPPPTPSTSSQHGATALADAANAAPRAAVGVSTICNVGKSSENQDSYVASSNTSGSKCLVGVFDGHGEQGKRMSEFAKVNIAKSLFNSKDLHSNPASALESAYADAQKQIERLHGGDALHSGTTAVAAYQHRDRLFIANVGDSRAVLGRCGSRESTGGMRAIELSSDQRPGRADERKRILAVGGVVQQSQYPVRQTIGGPPRLMRVGPERVWDRTGCCGLGVTRSLGDLGMHPFVVANPEIHERQIDSRDKLLILGSDGVWDRLRSQEAVDIASRHADPTMAAREITDCAKQRWHQETGGQVSDDITAVVVRLEHCADLQDGAALPALASTMQAPRSRRGSAESARPDTVSNDMSVRFSGVRQRRRASEGTGARNRKLPVHNWKGPP